MEAPGAPGVVAVPGIDSAVSLPVDVAEGTEEMDPELLALQGEEAQSEAPKQKKRWMDFDQFSVCFRYVSLESAGKCVQNVDADLSIVN